MRNYLLLIVCLLPVLSANAKRSNIVITSPDGKMAVTINAERSVPSAVSFTLSCQKKALLSDCRLGMETADKRFDDLRLVSVTPQKRLKEEYDMLQGKRLHCVSESNNRTFCFANKSGDIIKIDFRVANDGAAFRYTLPLTKNMKGKELTTYNIPDGTKRWIQNYDPGYEQFFPLSTDGKYTPVRRGGLIVKENCWGYPALLEPVESLFVLITESDIQRHHSASWLNNKADLQRYQVELATEELVAAGGEWTSPWRLLMAGTLDKIVESTMVTDVASKAQTGKYKSLKELSWIKPAPVSWIYWAYNHGSRELSIIKKYIDLAAQMHWPYMLIDAEWDEMTNGNTVEEALDYAHSRGIIPMLWYNSSTAWINGAPGPKFRLNKREDRLKEFQWLKDHGVAGVKIDFFDGDNTETMDYCMDLLEDAMTYDLLVTLHGAAIPRGWQRTYPNLMTIEGVYGAEWYNNMPVLTPKAAAHNATLPFTRNVIGPMDYTPGTFSDSQHKHITSHGHELALSFLFESPLQHMPDRPEAYAALPKDVKQLLSELPTAWEDTRLLSGYPADHVVMARRSGGKWFVAGINGTDEARTLVADLSKLQKKGAATQKKGKSNTYNVTLFSDGKSQLEFAPTIKQQPRNNTLEVKCLPRGGFVAVVQE